MTTINNSSAVSTLPNKSVCVADNTRVVVEKANLVLNKSDNLSIKANFGPVPAKENIKFEKKENHSASATKVVAELVSSGLNLLVKHEPKSVVVSTDKALTAVVKGGSSMGAFVGKAMPGIVNGINVGITLYDSHDAYVKLTDKNISLPGKALSVSTVGLDLVTVFAHNLGYGKTAALASVVSIGTSLASDYYK